MTFGARLAAAVDDRGPLCVGIDPHPALLTAWGLRPDVDGLARFADLCADAFADVAAVVKPQSAFFELHGSAGIAVLERTIAACRASGALVLLDVKRGDIGSTMAAYAQAYLDPAAPLAADAITLSPYPGFGSLAPALEMCRGYDAGAFVLSATSNPDGPQVQHAQTAAGVIVAQAMVDAVTAVNAGAQPLGSIGVVAGATIEPGVIDFTGLNGPILAPGIGTQGGTARSVRRIFGPAIGNVLPTVSRDVLQHGPDIHELTDAVHRLIDEFGFLRS